MRGPEAAGQRGCRLRLRHAFPAVVLTATPATRRQAALAFRREGQKRGSERQAKKGQQRNGYQLTQCLIEASSEPGGQLFLKRHHFRRCLPVCARADAGLVLLND